MKRFIPVKKLDAGQLKKIRDGALAMRVRKLGAYPKKGVAELPEECNPDEYILERKSKEWKDAYQAARTEAGKRDFIIAVG